MAEKRMIAKNIVDSDAFLDMPQSAQNLYFHLNIRADDEGFIDNPKKIMRVVGSNQNDLEILLSKRYILGFESGVIVIKHWKLHNCIRKDRVKPTVYQEEKGRLEEKENGAYTDIHLTDNCQPNVSQVTDECPLSIDKISIDKISIGEKEPVSDHLRLTEKEQEELTEEYGDDLLREVYEEIEHWISNRKKGKFSWTDHKRGIKNWIKKKAEFEAERRARGSPNDTQEKMREVYDIITKE